MGIRRKIRRFLWEFGYDISPFHPEFHSVARMRKLLNWLDIDVVMDVGANKGQFVWKLRGDLGYENKIISFEPLSSAFEVLSRKAKDDKRWEVHNFALGATEEEMEINISGNSQSSSFRDILSSHTDSEPQSRYVGKEVVKVRTLDAVSGELLRASDNVYLKIDTQGFEKEVLDGAASTLNKIDTVQLEMSLVPLYEGEVLFKELYERMKDSGYSLVGMEPGMLEPDSGRILQVNGIFHRF